MQTKITLFIFQITVKIRIHHQTRSRTLYKLIYRGIFYPAFLPVCVRVKFWDRLILPQILVIFKSPTTKIDFVDFFQIQAVFWKTNYTTFSYLGPVYMEVGDPR